MALMPPPRRSPRFSGSTTNDRAFTKSNEAARSQPYASSSRNVLPASPDVDPFVAGAPSSSRSGFNGNNGNKQKGERARIMNHAAGARGDGDNISDGVVGDVRRERRFEEIESDDENDDSDQPGNFLTNFDRPVITGNARHAASIPVPRKPRATFHEEAGDDGFIFSSAQSQSNPIANQRAVPGAKGFPPQPSLPSSVDASAITSGGKGKAVLREQSSEERTQLGTSMAKQSADRYSSRAHIVERRVSSSTVKAARRMSSLRDGTTAHPHPNIADGDLFRHCSSDMNAQERLRHMANWTLDRSAKKLVSRFEGSSHARSALKASLQSTLRSLARGGITLDWPGRQGSRKVNQPKLRPHPRNEANRRTEKQLLDTVQAMQGEVEQWEHFKDELAEFEEDVEALERKAEEITQESRSSQYDDTHGLRSLLLSDQGEHDEQDVVAEARLTLARQAPWLQHVLESRSTGDTQPDEALIRLINELYQRLHDQPIPDARPVKRRRTTSARGDEDFSSASDPSSSKTTEDLLGTEADKRWHDLEWNVDRLRANAHTIAQLGQLAERYTTCVSARGAQAIGDLINTTSTVHASVGTASSTNVGGNAGQGSPSKISRESQQTLQRILSGIRRVEDASLSSDGQMDIDSSSADRHLDAQRAASAAAQQTHQADVSDGDILRAFAGISGRRRR